MAGWSVDVWQLAVLIVIALGIIVLAVAVLYGMTHERTRTGGEYGSIRDWIRREPVRFRAYVVAIVGAAATLAADVFGVEISDGQTAAVVGVIVTVAVAVSEMGRRKVTPVEAPNLPRYDELQ